MTSERDARALSAVADLGTCTPRQVRDRALPECTVHRVSRILRSLARYRMIATETHNGRIYYGPLDTELRPPTVAPRAPPRPGRRPVPSDDDILEAVRRFGPCVTAVLVDNLPLSETWIRKRLCAMEKEGRVVRINLWSTRYRRLWCVPTDTLPAPHQSGREGEASQLLASYRHTRGYNDVDSLIRDAIRGGGCMTTPEVVRATGLRYHVVRDHLMTMDAEGTVVRWGMRGNAIEWRLVAGGEGE